MADLNLPSPREPLDDRTDITEGRPTMSILPEPAAGDAEQASKQRTLTREPVITLSAVTALAMAVCVLLRELGLPISPGLQAAIAAVAGLLFPLVAGFIARRLVTPLVDPRDNDGNTLTPQPPHGPTQSNPRLT